MCGFLSNAATAGSKVALIERLYCWVLGKMFEDDEFSFFLSKVLYKYSECSIRDKLEAQP